MSKGFVQFTKPEDFLRLSDTAYSNTFEQAASFEERAQRFNARARRTHTGDSDTVQKLRSQIAFTVALYHEFFEEQLRHFLPPEVEGHENEHHIKRSDEDGIKGSFERTLMFDFARAHFVRACHEMHFQDLVTTELLVNFLGKKNGVPEKGSPAEETVRAYARAQATRIREIFDMYQGIHHFTPDPKVVKLVQDAEIGPILLGKNGSPDTFMEMIEQVPLNTPSKAQSLDWE